MTAAADTQDQKFYYVTPGNDDWPKYNPKTESYTLTPPEGVAMEDFTRLEPMWKLTPEEQESLSCVAIFCDIKQVRGGKASTLNHKKTSVVRAEWRKTSTLAQLLTRKAKAAHDWLMSSNATYNRFQELHLQILEENKGKAKPVWFIATSYLLLHLDGVEVAARPVLYARSSMGDTDLRGRLGSLGHIKNHQLPSIKKSFMRKYLSRCYDYSKDFLLLCLIYDIALARSLMQLVSIAQSKDLSPDGLANHLHSFDSYWRHQQAILEDKCRQLDRLPKLFITVAPAEWTFPLHAPTLACYSKQLSDVQGYLTLHIYEARWDQNNNTHTQQNTTYIETRRFY